VGPYRSPCLTVAASLLLAVNTQLAMLVKGAHMEMADSQRRE
jgi:hypothetical protein